jgi:hypothetical protein
VQVEFQFIEPPLPRTILPVAAPMDRLPEKVLFAVNVFAPAIVGIVLSMAWVCELAETAFVEVLVTEPPAPSVTLPDVVIAVLGDIPLPGVMLVTVPLLYVGMAVHTPVTPLVDVVTLTNHCPALHVVELPVLAIVELPIKAET